MALSDAYMLRDFQTYEGEEILNVYFFQDLLLASIAQNLVEAYETGFLPKVKAIQTSNVVHVKLDAVNLADPSNFYEKVIAVAGDTTSDPLPAHDAVNYSLRINSRSLRPGSKRYCGVAEEYTTKNLITNAGYIALLETLRVQQSDILLSGVVETFQPIVVKRVKYNPDPLQPDKFAYRLPEDDGEYVFGDVVDSLLNLKVSHQVSRGNGR